MQKEFKRMLNAILAQWKSIIHILFTILADNLVSINEDAHENILNSKEGKWFDLKTLINVVSYHTIKWYAR